VVIGTDKSNYHTIMTPPAFHISILTFLHVFLSNLSNYMIDSEVYSI
jgi:hypothetical protein